MAVLDQELINNLTSINAAIPGLNKRIFSQYLLFCKSSLNAPNSFKPRYKISDCVAYAFELNNCKEVFLFTNLILCSDTEALGIERYDHPLFAICDKCNVGDSFSFNEIDYKIVSRSKFSVTSQVKSAEIKKFQFNDQWNNKLSHKYILYYSQNNSHDEGKCYGDTIKQLRSEFYISGKNYKYAWIIEISTQKIVYAYSEEWGRFVSFIKRKPRDNSESYVHPIQIFGETVFRTKKRQYTKTHED